MESAQTMDLVVAEVPSRNMKPESAKASSVVAVGSLVWVENPVHMWEEATVTAVAGDKITTTTRNGNVVVSNMELVYPMDADEPLNGLDDMTKLSYLHEPGVLQNLYTRYRLDMIYTYTGSILIAVNPFQKMPHLYGVHMMEQYRNARLGELSPHVFAVADAAYKAMMDEQKSQAILVSGESGAGKTETTKLLMQYLAFMGGRSGVEGRTVEQQVLESNPLLEAFGNAKTIRNNNSSRFGKFVEIQFNKGKISGAAIRTYLLERSRVVQISSPERNYHCFYQLCAGASPEEVERFKLLPAGSFHYLNQSTCLTLPRFDEAGQYHITRNAMDIVGMSSEEQDSIFRVIAAILHLGNIEFGSGKDNDSSYVQEGQAKFHLQAAAELLMCNEQKLEDSLTTRMIVTVGDSVTKCLDRDAATGSRDTLAKTLYARLFDWLVEKMNLSIGQDPHSTVLIGVLDIYGFESFDVNSFEQFCINLTNEKLQQHFNTHVFKMEQEEYRREEIDWSDIEFLDNIDVLDLIEKKPLGIIALLDEACMFPKTTPQSFANLLYTTFSGHKRFRRPKFGRALFGIDHYAGEVTYTADLFLEKNRDYVINEHRELMQASACPFVANLFPSLDDAKNTGKGAPKGGSSFSSIGSRFRLQLQALMETLSTTQPHYVRCIKPNSDLSPQKFDNKFVLQQLRCSGVLEAVRISCAGFPTRRTFAEFVDRFLILYPDAVSESPDDEAVCMRILQHVGLQGYQIGRTKVFLRAGHMAILDTKRTEILTWASSLVTRKARTFLLIRAFRRLRKATIVIQSHWRARLAREHFEVLRCRKAALVIQKYARGFRQRKEYLKLRAAATRIQSSARMRFAKRQLQQLKEHRAATIIQAKWCMYRSSKKYQAILHATITLQCGWRAKIARRELRGLKQQARDTGLLREAKDRLTKEVEELTLRLLLEKRKRMDVEQEKKTEMARVMEMMEDMKEHAEEAKSALAKERQISQTAVEQAQAAAREAAVAEALEEIQKLKEQNGELKGQVEAAESRASGIESRLKEVISAKDDLAMRMQEEQAAANSLREALDSMEEKIGNLQSENQVLRQQALDMVQLEEMARQDSIRVQQQAERIERLESANEDLQKLVDRVSELESEKCILETQAQRVLKLEADREEWASQREEWASQREEWASQREELEKRAVEAIAREQVAATRSEEIELQKLEVEERTAQKVAELEAENLRLKVSEEGIESKRAELEAQTAQKIAELESEKLRLKRLSKARIESHRAEIEAQAAQKLAELESENLRLKQVVSTAAAKKAALAGARMAAKSGSSLNSPNPSAVEGNASEVSSAQPSIVASTRIHRTSAIPVPIVPPLASIVWGSLGNTVVPRSLTPSAKTEAAAGQTSGNQMPAVTSAPEAQIPTLIAQMAAAAPSIVAHMATGPAHPPRHSAESTVAQQGIDRTQSERETRADSRSRVRPGEQLGTGSALSDQLHRLGEGYARSISEHVGDRRLGISPSTAAGEYIRGKEELLSRPVDQRRQRERVRSSRMERDVDALLRVMADDVGFDKDSPVTAVVMFRSLYHWNSFTAERTTVFNRIISKINCLIDANVENNRVLAYWLSNVSTLLALLQRAFKPTSSSAVGARRRKAAAVSQSVQVTRGLLSPLKNEVGTKSFSHGSMENAWSVEAKYPALLFKQHLAAHLERLYGLVRDNLKKDMVPVISECIKAPALSRTRSFSGNAKIAPSAKQEGSGNWDAMIQFFKENLDILKEKRVPAFLIRKLFSQTFAFIDVQMFNSLLLRRECCSLTNGMYMKEGIVQLAHWFRQIGPTYAGTSWDALQHIRQAVTFLVFQRKQKKTLDEIMRELCPQLSVQQLYRISTMYWDEKFQTKSVSPEVMSMLRTMMMVENEEADADSSNSFLLDDNLMIPFSVDEVASSIPDIDVMAIEPPSVLKNVASFYFLRPSRE